MADTDDLKSHQQMWHIFTKMVVYGSIAVTITLLLMRLFLV